MYLDKYLAIRDTIFSNKKNIITIPNVSYGFFIWGEADILTLTKSKYLIEGEIKTTLSDLKKDAKKKKWNVWLDRWKKDIKRHWYIIPTEILERGIKFMRPDSGIMTYEKTEFEFQIKIIRNATDNKAAEKLSNEKIIKLCRLISFRYWSYASN